MSIFDTILEQSPDTMVVAAIWDTEFRNWFIQITVFEEGEAQFTITSSQANLVEVYRLVDQARRRVGEDFASGQLTLPNMGDWAVEYHKV